jgi:hypothetical protein
MERAAFQLLDYAFDKISLNFEGFNSNSTFLIDFKPSGIFKQKDAIFLLTFLFEASIEGDNANNIASIRCVARFKFKEQISFEEIPNFFYPNSIAILVPFIRAFVSTVSLQANIKPIILPTLNLTSLQDSLKENTIAID